MEYLKYIIAGFAPFIVLYLLGSFTAASFDIMQWNQDGRFVVALAGFGLGGIAVFAVSEFDRS